MIDAPKDTSMGVVYAFMVTLSLVAGVVMTVLKRSNNAKADTLKSQLNGLGKRVNDHDQRITRNETVAGDFRAFRDSSESDRKRLWEARGEDKARMESMEQVSRDSSHDIMEAIRASGIQQMEAVHKVELQVATLAAKQDVAMVLTDTLGKIAAIMERRERGENQ